MLVRDGGLSLAGWIVLICLVTPGLAAAESLSTSRSDDALIIHSSGKEVLRYQLQPNPKSGLPVESACYFHPLTTPKGTVVTDLAPADHKHHRGIFLAWVAMDGSKPADFWGWGALAPKENRQILNRKLPALQISGNQASFGAENEWRAEGETFLREHVEAIFKADPAVHQLDLTYTFRADREVTIRQTAFSGFCVRVPITANIESRDSNGVIGLPSPAHDRPETGWPARRWYAYIWRNEQGEPVGVAVVDHPSNPASLWHNNREARMINPCISSLAPVVIRPDKPLVLHYTVVAFDGAVPLDLLAALPGG